MIVFSEASIERPTSSSAQDNLDVTQAARLAGLSVYYIPTDFSVCETAENALWHVPEQPEEMKAIWIGFIPSAERYRAMYDAALAKNIRLINSPEEHLIAQEFDRAYDLLKGITPQSMTLTRPEEYSDTASSLGFPLFVRGSVRSRKADGLKACVATTPGELKELVDQFFSSEYRSRGRVIVRQFVELRHTRFSKEGFPLGREYRLFFLNQKLAAYSYYWEGSDPLEKLSPDEIQDAFRIASEAASRLKVPFVAVDIGQTTNGDWIVIEVNDAQFAGICQIPALFFWNSLIDIDSQ